MPDREKVIRGLECCGRWTGDALWDEVRCSQCPYDSTEIGCGHRLTADALALLREQEPTTYAYDEYMTPNCQTCGFHPFIAYIPTLERMEQNGYNYCPGCGKRINWNG